MAKATPKTKQQTSGDSERDQAAWGEASHSEPRWPAVIAVVLAIVLYQTLPSKLTIGPPWALSVIEGALLLPLLATSPRRTNRESRWQRVFALVVIALINLANVISLVALVQSLVSGHKEAARQLIFFSMQIWFTNVLVFALWYWELDRGGPGQRCLRKHREPDFLFPQMATPAAATAGWHPSFVDYLYVSFTNATAFSPTDTMPLTEWAKLLMMIQAFASLITVALVAARAVNVLT
ncbi:MAG: DUF1345 domain-containing protein [Chloroflexota bacterium]|nr:DUF1345 domain-containing protein [Chloroflexota bacterium]